MGCTYGIAANITNDCDKPPKAGLERIAVVFKRADVDTVTYNATNSHIVEAISLTGSEVAFKVEGFKNSSNAGHDIVINDNAPDSYKHFFSLMPWGLTGAEVEALDNLGDVVVIVENKQKGVAGDGAFEIYGLETGLHKSADTRRTNDNLGVQSIELTTRDGEDAAVSRHVFFKTDYAATKALVEALLT